MIYEVNGKMKLLGQQNVPSEEVCIEIRELIDTRFKNKEYSPFELAMDSYLLGLMQGKKDERLRKKAVNKRAYDVFGLLKDVENEDFLNYFFEFIKHAKTQWATK